MDVRPLDIISRMWAKGAGQLMADGGRLATGILNGRVASVPVVADMARWNAAWLGSLAEDPVWHARWMADVSAKWVRLGSTTRLRDPRMKGPAQIRLTTAGASR
jgi:hypothetical protein